MQAKSNKRSHMNQSKKRLEVKRNLQDLSSQNPYFDLESNEIDSKLVKQKYKNSTSFQYTCVKEHCQCKVTTSTREIGTFEV
jgi:hypothetical protein